MQPKNPFTLTFGVVPNNYIHRAEAEEEEEEIRLKFLESDTGLMYLITGVRGSGKTVFMENIVDHVSQVKKKQRVSSLLYCCYKIWDFFRIQSIGIIGKNLIIEALFLP